MTVTATWVPPSAAGALDLATGAVITEAWVDGIASNFLFLGGATGFKPWVAWTPTMSQSSGITFTNNFCVYANIGGIAHVQVSLSLTSAGTAANALSLASVPAALTPKTGRTDGSARSAVAGVFSLFDANTSTTYTGYATFISTSALIFTTNASTGAFGVNPAITIASGDIFNATLMYELN